jgi:broad specificity phosphatase PhoE
MITKQSFWRKYSSDLGRAQRTTNLILGEEDCLEDLDVELEPLLREVAKGVREMYPKKLTYEQAEARFRQDYGPEEPFPLLESEEQVMARVYRWMFQVVREAIEEYRLECQANKARRGGTRLYPVFAVSHSATLRVLITHLVRDELPKGIDFTPVGRDGAHSRSLDIPNTSVTVIDIIPHDVNDELWDAERTSQQVPADPSFLWTAKLKTLTYTTYNQNV